MSKDTIETDDKRLALRVFGLTEGELAALREIACKEYGKPSVSLCLQKIRSKLGWLHWKNPNWSDFHRPQAAGALQSAFQKKTVPTSKPPPKSTKAA